MLELNMVLLLTMFVFMMGIIEREYSVPYRGFRWLLLGVFGFSLRSGSFLI